MNGGQKQQWLALVRKELRGRMAAHSVAGALADRLNSKTGQLNPSYQTLANDCGVSEKTAKRAVQELIGANLIERTRPGGRGRHSSNHYRLKGVADEPIREQSSGGHRRTSKSALSGSRGGAVRGSTMTRDPEGINPAAGAPLVAAPGAQVMKEVGPVTQTDEQVRAAREHLVELRRIMANSSGGGEGGE